jgi:hypothetical protein
MPDSSRETRKKRRSETAHLSVEAHDTKDRNHAQEPPSGTVVEGVRPVTPPPEPAHKTILEPIKFITWIGASVGGLTIILAVIGFLALGAHDSMIGIPRRLLAQPEYVTVGALFFSRTMTYIIAVLLSPFSALRTALITLVVLLVIAVAGYYVWTGRLIRRGRLPGRRLLLTVGPVLLLVGELFVLQKLTAPLQITNALLQFADLDSLASIGTGEASDYYLRGLINGQSKQLQFAYGTLSLMTLGLGLAYRWLEVANSDSYNRSAASERRPLLWQWTRIPCFALLLLSLFFLVRVYGVLTVSNDYPRLEIAPAAEQKDAKRARPLFLLREDDKYLLIYEPCSQSILNMKRDSVEQLKINAPHDIFLYQRDSAAEECKGE